jgi:hypothetical protein
VALRSRQITLSASTITPLLVQGTSGTQFPNITGTTSDPIPVSFMITSGTVYYGGPDVSASNGMVMVANVPVNWNIYSNDIPYVFSAGTPVVTVVCGRQ